MTVPKRRTSFWTSEEPDGVLGTFLITNRLLQLTGTELSCTIQRQVQSLISPPHFSHSPAQQCNNQFNVYSGAGQSADISLSEVLYIGISIHVHPICTCMKTLKKKKKIIMQKKMLEVTYGAFTPHPFGPRLLDLIKKPDLGPT